MFTAVSTATVAVVVATSACSCSCCKVGTLMVEAPQGGKYNVIVQQEHVQYSRCIVCRSLLPPLCSFLL